MVSKIQLYKLKTEVTTNMLDITTKTTRMYTWWFHITKGSVKASKDYAENMGYKCTSREDFPSKTSLWLQRIKILSLRNVESYTDTNVIGWSVMKKYTGESARMFAERFKEHQKAPSPIYDHYKTSGHSVTIDNFSIVGREEQNLMRTIKEALYIRVNNASFNRNIGKYHLPHIWNEVLFNTPELKLK